MGHITRLVGAAYLAFAASASVAHTEPDDDFPKNPTRGVEACTADGKRATWFFHYDMDSMYLHHRGVEGYRTLLNQLQKTIDTTLIPEWTAIVRNYQSADIMAGRVAPQAELFALIEKDLARYGRAEDGTPNIWVDRQSGGMRDGDGLCPAPL